MTPRKTAAQIKAIIVSQIETSMSTTVPILPKAFIRVIAKVLGGLFVLLYEHIGFMLLQMFVKTATNDPINVSGTIIRPLSEWGALVDINQDAGQAAELYVSISVLTQGGTLNSGTMLLNTSSGLTYIAIGDVSLDSATVYANVRATKNGIIGNLDDDSILNFVSPPPSIEKTAVVDSTVTVGVDQEDVEDYRSRILRRWAARPQGGAYADYWDWCMEVTGVKAAYPYSGWDHPDIEGSRSGCDIIFIESKTDEYGIPTLGGALLTAVYDNIQMNESGLANRRPINAYLDLTFIRPIIRYVVNVTIGELTVEDEATAKTAIEDGLSEFLLDREPYILGLMPPPRKDMVSLAEIGGTAARIAASYGGFFGSISATIDGDDLAAYYLLQEGEKVRIGTVAWI
jgi:uncharacterized phage protein gp47/JayE